MMRIKIVNKEEFDRRTSFKPPNYMIEKDKTPDNETLLEFDNGKVVAIKTEKVAGMEKDKVIKAVGEEKDF